MKEGSLVSWPKQFWQEVWWRNEDANYKHIWYRSLFWLYYTFDMLQAQLTSQTVMWGTSVLACFVFFFLKRLPITSVNILHRLMLILCYDIKKCQCMSEDTCPLLEFLREVPLISSTTSPRWMNLSTSAWLPGIRSRTKTRPLRYLRDGKGGSGRRRRRSEEPVYECLQSVERKNTVRGQVRTLTPALPPCRVLHHMSHTPKNIEKTLSLQPPPESTCPSYSPTSAVKP